MPRRRADADGTAPPPKPRQRKKKGEAAAEAAALAAAQQPNELDMPGTSVAGPGGMPFDPSMCGMGPGAHPSPAAMLHRQNSVTGAKHSEKDLRLKNGCKLEPSRPWWVGLNHLGIS